MTPACPHDACDGSGFLVDEETNTARPCRCRPQRISRARARSLSAVIPRRYENVSFDRAPIVNMDPTPVRSVRKFVDDIDAQLDAGHGLWFMGDVGTGKTTLAMLVSKAALRAGRSVAIYSLPRLLAEIRKTYDDRSEHSYLGLLARLSEVDLLHVDDLGAEKTSEWVLEQLYSIINARYEDQRSVVVTTNLTDPDVLREQITERTVSRLMEMCTEVPIYGRDRRKDRFVA